jgi:hypothetical protein
VPEPENLRKQGLSAFSFLGRFFIHLFLPMTKKQFLILNTLALAFLLLTGLRFLLLKDIETRRVSVTQAQAVIAQGQQSEQVLRQIILRVARASQAEPDLKDLLQQFKIKLDPSPASAPSSPAGSANADRPKTN